jgi:protein involved in polysaccharide export with SLBB domain
MSDDAVVAYVKDGMASGKSQNDMVKELAARGVTRAQAERLKARFEQEQAAQNNAAKTAGAQERQRRLNDGILETEAGDIDVIAAEIVEPGQKRVFGRNIFTSRNLTFAPSSNIPTPTNYKLGPGDEVIIDIWGTNQATIRQTISPEGTINIPDIGVVNLNGMTVKDADSYMRRKLGQIYSVDGDNAKSEIKLTLGNIRTIQVNLMGEVANPGTYYLSSLSNLYHALHRAGGVSQLGSLRDIQLVRNGKKIASVDVYDFILDGKMEGNLILEEGDIIIVPTYKKIVDLTGNVKRPMSFELKDGETVQDLLNYAGGFAGDAYKENIRMIRQNGKEYQVFTIDEPDYATFLLMDGDALAVGAMLDRFANKLEIKGAVYRPGTYQLGNGIETVSQLISKADGLKGDAFTNRALLHREREDLTLEVIPIDIKAVLNGTAADIELKKNDVLYIPSVHDLKDLGYISVGGEVARPGQFVFAENTTLEDAIMLAGGLLESASTVRIDVSRRIKNPTSIEQSATIGEVYTFSFKDGYIIDGDSGFKLQPYDNVYVRRSPGYVVQASVTISGEVIFPGQYVMTQKEERLSDLVSKAGGLNNWAYVKGARLMRRMNSEERARAQATRGILDSAKDSINIASLDFSEVYSVGIDLEKALANPGGDMDLVLREGDQLIIPELINTVKISGNVFYPNTVTYSSDLSVRDYVMQAGGYGYKSKRNKAYIIYMNGTVARAKQLSSTVVQPGCEIVIPQKKMRNGGLEKFLSVATTSSSIATMLATVGNIVMNSVKP